MNWFFPDKNDQIQIEITTGGPCYSQNLGLRESREYQNSRVSRLINTYKQGKMILKVHFFSILLAKKVPSGASGQCTMLYALT